MHLKETDQQSVNFNKTQLTNTENCDSRHTMFLVHVLLVSYYC